ncbi:MAG: hypothetical protein ACK5XS_10995, partial [Armatimonadota bacterium]
MVMNKHYHSVSACINGEGRYSAGVIGLIALLAPPQEPAAFRAVFEDRPRQLIVRLLNEPGDGGI